MARDYYSETSGVNDYGIKTVKSGEDVRNITSQLASKIQRLSEIWESDSSRQLAATFGNIQKDLNGFADVYEELGKTIQQTASNQEETEANLSHSNNFYNG